MALSHELAQGGNPPSASTCTADGDARQSRRRPDRDALRARRHRARAGDRRRRLRGRRAVRRPELPDLAAARRQRRDHGRQAPTTRLEPPTAIGVLDRAEPLDLDPHDVAGLEEARGSIDRPTPRGVPVRIRSPGASVHVSREKSTTLAAAEDQVGRPAVLAQLAVDPRAQREVLRVRDLVGGRDPRPPRAERVGRPSRASTAARDRCRSRALTSSARRSRRSRRRRPSRRQLALVVEPLDDVRAAHRTAGPADEPAAS